VRREGGFKKAVEKILKREKKFLLTLIAQLFEKIKTMFVGYKVLRITLLLGNANFFFSLR